MVFLFKERYINLLTDFGFKRVFGTEANKQFTIDFLNTVLPEHHHIQDLTFEHNENLGITAFDRRAIFDVFCEGSNGEQFIVEMQRTRQAFFRDRSLFYATFPIQEQSTRGDWDYQLTPVYTVSVLDFIMDRQQENPKFIHRVALKDDDGKQFYDKFSFIYIELPKFNKALSQLTSHEDKWLYVFRHLSEFTSQPQPLSDPIFDDLFEVAEIANFSPDEQDVYQVALKTYSDWQNVTTTVIQEAEEKAEEKGRAKGREEGREEERSHFLVQQRTLLIKLLTRQLGELAPDLHNEIQKLSLSDLDALANALFDFQQTDDLKQWLEDYLS